MFCQKPHYNNLKLYKELQKAEASLLLQTRTGRISLASFLFRAGVSDFPTPLCMCGQVEETVKYITSSCSLYSSQRQHALFVTVLAQLHIWHKSRTLPGSSICTVACLLCHCLVAYLAQVTHLAGKFHLHCCLFAPPYPLPIRTSPAPPASSLLLFSFPSLSFVLYINPSLKSQAKSGQGYRIS